MATRFLAVISHERGADADFMARLRKNTGFTVAIDHAPLTVLVQDIAGVVSCSRDDCIALGWLFGRSDFRRRAMIDASTVGAMELGNFTPLLRDYWGGYVALVADRKTSAVTVLRDPSGGLPCYYHRTPAATFLFSDLATWREANIEPVAVDWTGVGHRLSTASLPSSRTALKGVNELCAGFALEVSDRPPIPRAAWFPWDHVSAAPDRSTGDLASALRDTVLQCIGAWTGQFNSVLLNLSGGLDSSIIAAGLAGRANSDAAITMATRSPSGDERDYARSVSVPSNASGNRVVMLTTAPIELPG
jgi:asparagine synthase (glutamine-hydrolysing)